jgi:hypothetical protein
MKRLALAAAALLLALASCGKPEDAWKSPADDAALAKLSVKSLRTDLSRQDRARLFFLWGQELAARARSGQGNASANSEDSLRGAIAAFEKVVDLNSILVPESRRNLELLWKGQNQSGESQNQQNGKQDQQNGKQDQQNQKSQEQKTGAQGEGAKDMSALVRDKEGGKDIEAALQAEMERQARSERLQAEKGNMSPVEKDW